MKSMIRFLSFFKLFIGVSNSSHRRPAVGMPFWVSPGPKPLQSRNYAHEFQAKRIRFAQFDDFAEPGREKPRPISAHRVIHLGDGPL